jgi:hypothetical protein
MWSAIARSNFAMDVTYYVALPFVAADDGVAAGEAVECFNPNAAVMKAEDGRSRNRRLRRCDRHPEIRRRAFGFERTVKLSGYPTISRVPAPTPIQSGLHASRVETITT